jgi:transposase-like protein
LGPNANLPSTTQKCYNRPRTFRVATDTLGKSLDDKIIASMVWNEGHRYTSSHEDMYRLELCQVTLNTISDDILLVIREWQARPLEEIYPCIWMDAIHYKARDEGKIILKAVYTILGLNVNGIKDVIVNYISES